MGEINLDNTGSGGAVTLSSDGTSLLLDGSAIGGGGGDPDLYRDNASSATTPVASGANAFAIGTNTTASNTSAIAIGADAVASGYQAQAIGNQTDATATNSSAFGNGSQATASNATAIGGATASSSYSTAIGKNSVNNASVATSGNAAMALGGSYASGADSFAAAVVNTTSSYGATGSNSIAMGLQAKATNTQAIAISGNASTASGIRATSIGGENNTASGTGATALGGSTNYATGQESYAFGNRASAKEIGKYSYGGYFGFSGTFSGGFGVGGSQGGMMVLGAATTDATPTVLRTNTSAAGSTNQLVAFTDTCITFDGTITAMQNGAQSYASWRIEGLLVNDGGTTTVANSAITTIYNTPSWGLTLTADNTNNALAITFTGEAAHNIRTVANIRTSEVTYA